jgi:hypothetical protein
MLETTKKESEERGLLLNLKKTKIMVIDRNRTVRRDFVLDNDKIEEVEDFIFLGSLISSKGGSLLEIKRRLGMGRSAVQRLATIWRSKSININLKVRLIHATAFAIATYGCESWAMSDKERKKVNAFELWAYRRILRTCWTEKRTNQWILEKVGVKKRVLLSQITRRKLAFFGHAIRRNGLEKEIMQGMVEGSRRRGRPALRWNADIQLATRSTFGEASSMAMNRVFWRKIVNTAANTSAN